MPARIYQNCVEENDAVSSKTESSTPTEAVKKKKRQRQIQAQNRQHPQTAKSKQDSTALKLWLTSGSKRRRPPDETTSPTEGSKEKKRARPQRERFEEYKSRLQEKGIVINDENRLWEKFRSIRGRLDYGQIGEFVTFPERKPRGNAKNGNRSERRNNERNSQTRHDGSQEARDEQKRQAQ